MSDSVTRDRIGTTDIAAFCRRWRIVELSLFGSVLREDFRADSDVDVLVAFAPEVTWRIDELLEMRDELGRLFGHPVDLVERRLVEASENYIRREHILSHLKTLYVA